MMRGFCMHLVPTRRASINKQAYSQPPQMSGERMPGAAGTVTGSSELTAELLQRFGQPLKQPVRELVCTLHAAVLVSAE